MNMNSHTTNESIPYVEIEIEHGKLSGCYQQQVLDLNLRQSIPQQSNINTISKTYSISLGDRINIDSFQASSTINSAYPRRKLSIEITSMRANTLHLKITLCKNNFELEHYSPAKD
jgi:hypothetical protein